MASAFFQTHEELFFVFVVNGEVCWVVCVPTTTRCPVVYGPMEAIHVL